MRKGKNWLIFAIFAYLRINHVIIFAKFVPESTKKPIK
jgi:hypothetical protein